ncbi:hypothetical protein Hanom_Chr17g01537471 [Helianthus anomalus]
MPTCKTLIASNYHYEQGVFGLNFHTHNVTDFRQTYCTGSEVFPVVSTSAVCNYSSWW